jgi:hypothetical protein
VISIDSVLAELSGPVADEQAGVFTIDVEQAIRKLGVVQLPDSEFYLLKMVQAAVASGAWEIHIDVSWIGIVLKFSPPESHFVREENLFVHLLDSNSDSAFHHLAVGINSALGQGIRWVGVEQAGRRQVYSDKGSWIEECSPGNGVVIRVRRWAFVRSEIDLILKHCRWCSAAVKLNDEYISNNIQWADVIHSFHLAESYLFAQLEPTPKAEPQDSRDNSTQPCKRVARPVGEQVPTKELAKSGTRGRAPGPENRNGARYTFEGSSASETFGLCSTHRGVSALRAPGCSQCPLPPRLTIEQLGSSVFCQAMVALTNRSNYLAQIDLVKHGVVVETMRLDLGQPGLLVVIEASDLPTDLSGFKFLGQNEWSIEKDPSKRTPLQERIERVRAEAAEMRKRYELSRK